MVLAVVAAGQDQVVAVAEGGVWGEDRPPPRHCLRDQVIQDLRPSHQ